MSRPTYLVTGGNAGIGRALCARLAALDADVVLLCRNTRRAAEAVDEIRETTGNEGVSSIACDLASLVSVRACAEQVLEKHPRIDALVNNAGTTALAYQPTEDANELAFQVNYLGHYLLTRLLLDRLIASAPSRVVNVAGIFHKRGHVDLDDLDFEKRGFDMMAVNNASQLCRVLFTFELARRLEGTGVTANAVHPGAVLTGAQKVLPPGIKLLIHTVMRPGFVKPPKGAEPVYRLIVEPDLAEVSGQFFRRKRQAPSSDEAYDEELAAGLWAKSAERCGLD